MWEKPLHVTLNRFYKKAFLLVFISDNQPNLYFGTKRALQYFMRIKIKTNVLYPLTLAAVWLIGISAAYADAAMVDTATTSWNPVLYSTSESSSDQQSGQSSLDIVGNADNPSFYIQFDNGGTSSLTDGTLAFRVRLNSVKNEKKPAYDRVLQIGIDANRDGVLDLFVGVDHSANHNYNAIWQAGLDANTSPDTLSIASSPTLSYATLLGDNYQFAMVTALLDPDAQTFDVDGGGKNDWFLSFSINFNDIVNQLSLRNITADQNTHFGYVVTTALKSGTNQQDILGVTGSTTSSLSWAELAAASTPITPVGSMPEPTTSALIGVGFICLLIRRHLSR